MHAKRLKLGIMAGNSEGFQNELALDRFSAFLKPRLEHSTDLVDQALAASNTLLTLGYSLNNALAVITRLEPCRWSETTLHGQKHTASLLYAPIHLHETGPYHHSIVLPGSLSTPFEALVKAGPSALTEKPFSLKPKSLSERRNQIQRLLIKRLTGHFKAWASQEAKPSDYIGTFTLRNWANYLNNLAVTWLDIEPAYISMRQLSPLPADPAAGSGMLLAVDVNKQPQVSEPIIKQGAQPNETSALGDKWSAKLKRFNALYEDYARKQGWSDVASADIQRILKDDVQAELFYQFASDTCDQRPRHWIRKTKVALKSFTTLIQDEAFTLNPTNPGDPDSLLNRIETFISAHDEALMPFSVASLGILWVSEMLIRGWINRQTARDYLNNITVRSGLFHSMAHDMRLWDIECVEEFMECIEHTTLAASTNRGRKLRAHHFLRFCKKHGLLAEAPLPSLNGEYFSYERRNHLLKPEEVDRVLTEIAAQGFEDPDNQAAFAVIFLAFYAGLRSDEIYSLHLNRIQFYEPIYKDGEFGVGDKPHIAVKIIRGKTHNAKRTAYLHVHAATDLLTQFVALIDARKRMFKTRKHKNIPLLGYKADARGYVSSRLKYTVRRWVKERYFGKAFDVHTLRHGFATWLALRHFAAKYPQANEVLKVDWEMGCFCEDHLSALLSFMNWGHRSFPQTHYCHHFNVMAMIMGHGSITTTNLHYFHGAAPINYFHAIKLEHVSKAICE